MFSKVTRVVAVLTLVGLLVGAVPQSHARAWAPPPPVVAPVATGLCSTPIGVAICVVGGAIAAGVLVWQLWDDAPEPQASSIPALVPEQDGSWSFCHIHPTEALSECASEEGAPWLVEAPEITDLSPPRVEQPDPTGSSNWLNHWWDDVSYFIPLYGQEVLDASLNGVDVFGAKIEPIWDGDTVVGQRTEVFFEVNGLYGPGVPCPWGSLVGSGFNGHVPEWSPHACTGLVRALSSAMPDNPITQAQCSSGTPVTYTYMSGYGLIEEAVCEGGAWNMGATHTAFYSGNGTPDSVLNRHFVVRTCHRAGDGWAHSAHSNPRNCNGAKDIASWTTAPVWMTKVAEVEMVTTVATARCRDQFGNVNTRTAESEPVPWFEGRARATTVPCLPGELPTTVEYEVCPVSAWTDCYPTGGLRLPSTPEGVSMDCYYRAASEDPCVMWLEHWDGSEWVKCDETTGNCAGWWGDPLRDVEYRCGWGGDYLTASQCIQLRDFYEAPGQQPRPHNPNRPEHIPDPTVTEPGTLTGPPSQPGTAPTRTWYGRIIYEWTFGTVEGMENACWPQGWGLLNPAQWVLRPTLCALAWTFVPQTALELRLERVMEEVEVRLGLSPSMLLFTLPTVGSACGWGFSAWQGQHLDVPKVNVIPCPSELGPTGPTWASTSRALGYVVLGFGAWQLVHRWLTLRPHSGVDSEDGGVIV